LTVVYMMFVDGCKWDLGSSLFISFDRSTVLEMQTAVKKCQTGHNGRNTCLH